MIKIRAPKDFYSGLLFVAIGTLGAVIARNYPLGTLLRMGPGYFPTIVSWCVIVLGVIVALRALAIDGPAVTPVGWRALFFVLASLVTFGVLIAKTGLVLAVIATAMVGGLASRELGWIERLALSVGLAAFCALVFVYGLGQPIELWPR